MVKNQRVLAVFFLRRRRRRRLLLLLVRLLAFSLVLDFLVLSQWSTSKDKYCVTFVRYAQRIQFFLRDSSVLLLLLLLLLFLLVQRHQRSICIVVRVRVAVMMVVDVVSS
jgi:hypothetical protein